MEELYFLFMWAENCSTNEPIHEGGVNPSQQSEARSNDGENAIRTAESSLDHKNNLLC